MTNEEAIFDIEQFAFAPIGEGDLHMESIELALSALREQAEHEKGCEYCAGYEVELMLPVITMDENTANSLDINGCFAYIHCHCGRALKGGE